MSTVTPPQCVAAPFSITRARARLLEATDHVSRAERDLRDPGLEWDGRARADYEAAVLAGRVSLVRLGATLDRCVALLDAFTVVAEEDAARYAAATAAGGLS